MLDLALDRPIPLASHPACQQGYMLATPSIDEAYQHVKWCIRTRVPGSLIFAMTRFGKTYFIRYAKYMISLDFPGIVTIDIGCVWRKKSNEGAFFSLLLEAAGHPRPNTGTIPDRRYRLINKLVDLLTASGQKRLVIFADEAQKLELDEYEWLREVHDELERKGFRMTTFLVGQPKLVNRKTALKLSGDTQIVARFMIEECQFRGLRNEGDVRRCLKGYDESMFPQGSDWSFTRFFLPRAWTRGLRLEDAYPTVWQCFMNEHSALNLPGNIALEIPMTYFTRTVEYLLTEVAPKSDDYDFSFGQEHWKEAVTFSSFATAQDELLGEVELQ
jgi:AAA domain-containing protein